MEGERIGSTGLQNRNATGILQTDVGVVTDSIINLQKGKKKKKPRCQEWQITGWYKRLFFITS